VVDALFVLGSEMLFELVDAYNMMAIRKLPEAWIVIPIKLFDWTPGNFTLPRAPIIDQANGLVEATIDGRFVNE